MCFSFLFLHRLWSTVALPSFPVVQTITLCWSTCVANILNWQVKWQKKHWFLPILLLTRTWFRSTAVRLSRLPVSVCVLVSEKRIFFHCLIDACTYLCNNFLIFYVRQYSLDHFCNLRKEQVFFYILTVPFELSFRNFVFVTIKEIYDVIYHPQQVRIQPYSVQEEKREAHWTLYTVIPVFPHSFYRERRGFIFIGIAPEQAYRYCGWRNRRIELIYT